MHLTHNGFVSVSATDFDWRMAILPVALIELVRDTQPN